MMAYEPMVLFTAIAFYVFTGSFKVSDIMNSESMGILPMLGIFIGFMYILTIKFRKAPFDLSMSHHAHQELVAGLKTEFSGTTLAMLEIAHWYENIFLLGFVFLFFQTELSGVIIGIVVAIIAFFFETLHRKQFCKNEVAGSFQVSVDSSGCTWNYQPVPSVFHIGEV